MLSLFAVRGEKVQIISYTENSQFTALTSVIYDMQISLEVTCEYIEEYERRRRLSAEAFATLLTT